MCEVDSDCSNGRACLTGFCDPACEERRLRPVYFSFNQSAVRTDQLPVVEHNVLCLRAWHEDRVSVEGHVGRLECVTPDGEPTRCSEGEAAALSDRMARSVALTLEGYGVDGGQLECIAVGDLRPVCSEQSAACSTRSTRVELVWPADEPAGDTVNNPDF